MLSMSGPFKAMLPVETSAVFVIAVPNWSTGSGDTLGIVSISNRLLVGRDLGDRFQSDDSVVELIMPTVNKESLISESS